VLTFAGQSVLDNIWIFRSTARALYGVFCFDLCRAMGLDNLCIYSSTAKAFCGVCCVDLCRAMGLDNLWKPNLRGRIEQQINAVAEGRAQKDQVWGEVAKDLYFVVHVILFCLHRVMAVDCSQKNQEDRT